MMDDLIRCKDCKHIKTLENSFFRNGNPIHYCGSDYGLAGFIQENDFCSYAEKKDG